VQLPFDEHERADAADADRSPPRARGLQMPNEDPPNVELPNADSGPQMPKESPPDEGGGVGLRAAGDDAAGRPADAATTSARGPATAHPPEWVDESLEDELNEALGDAPSLPAPPAPPAQPAPAAPAASQGQGIGEVPSVAAQTEEATEAATAAAEPEVAGAPSAPPPADDAKNGAAEALEVS